MNSHSDQSQDVKIPTNDIPVSDSAGTVPVYRNLLHGTATVMERLISQLRKAPGAHFDAIISDMESAVTRIKVINDV